MVLQEGHTALEYKENPELLDVNKVQQRVLRIIQKAPVTERVKQQKSDTSEGQAEVKKELEAKDTTAEVIIEPAVKGTENSSDQKNLVHTNGTSPNNFPINFPLKRCF